MSRHDELRRRHLVLSDLCRHLTLLPRERRGLERAWRRAEAGLPVLAHSRYAPRPLTIRWSENSQRFVRVVAPFLQSHKIDHGPD